MSRRIYTKFEQADDGKVVLMLQSRDKGKPDWKVVEGVDFTHTSDEYKHKFLVYYRNQLEDYILNGKVGNFSTHTNDRHDPLYGDKIRDEIELWASRKVVML